MTYSKKHGKSEHDDVEDAFEQELREKAREKLRDREEALHGPQHARSHSKTHDRNTSEKTPRHAKENRNTPSKTSSSASLSNANFSASSFINSPLARLLLAVLILALLVTIVASALSRCSQGKEEIGETAEVPQSVEESQSADEPSIEEEPEPVSFTPSSQALDSIPSSTKTEAFSLSNASIPDISDEQYSAIQKAIDAASDQGDIGLVFYSLETGRGISHNADTAVYGASSFKGPYALYICETLIEPGTISLDSSCAGTTAYDPSSYYNGGSYMVSDLISDSIIYSDNNAYGSLRDSYDNMGFDEWVTKIGATDATYRADSWYPWYCARSSAKLWTEMYTYLESDTETATYLSTLLGQTEESFIRSALEETHALVEDKAGWCADSDPSYNGLCDAGIVTVDGHPFVLSIMTGMPDSDQNRLLLEDIARSVFDTHEALAS